MSVGYLTDSFDLINVRDLDLIAQAGERCAHLVLGVFTDEYAEQVFGRRPVVPLSERLAVLRHVRGVADVVAHDDTCAPSPDAVRFVVAGSPEPSAMHSVVITPRRESESTILRNALAAVLEETDADEAVA